VLTSVEPEVWFDELNSGISESDELRNGTVVWFWDGVDGLTYQGRRLSSPLDALSADDDGDTSTVVKKKMAMPLYATLQEFVALAQNRLTMGHMREGIMEAIGEFEALTEYPDPLLGKQGILCVRNFDRFLSPAGGAADPVILAHVLRFLYLGAGCQMAIVMQAAPGFEVPAELAEHTQLIEHTIPDQDQRQQLLTQLLDSMTGIIPDTHVTPLLLNATAGLSAGKLQQYTSEVIAANRRVDAMQIFQMKAKHLARTSKLDVWSPLFETRFRLWPDPEQLEGTPLEQYTQLTELMLTRTETSFENNELADGEIRAHISYLDSAGKPISEWLNPMPISDFDRLFRPERDYYSLNSIVGLDGLKSFLRNGLRPGIPERAKMRHVLMLGVPGTGKSFTMQCCSGEFKLPLSSMQAGNLYSKWLGETDKILDRMLRTVDEIGGILSIDEFQRFLPTGNNSEGGVESRMLGTLLTWFNNQRNTLVLSAANNISNLPDEITRSGRVDALIFVGFPGKESRKAAWRMYLKRHDLPNQELPPDDYWTPADIMSCCRLAELQRTTVKDAAKWITPSYIKNPNQMDSLLEWAEQAGCVCAETGERFLKNTHTKSAGLPAKFPMKATSRVVKVPPSPPSN
jgi:hypothetical protein